MKPKELLETAKDKRHCSGVSGAYLHQAVIYKKKNNKECIPLAYGINIYGKTSTRHAEDDAIKHLTPIGKKKNKVKVEILVIRITKNSKLCMSKPCLHCIECINKKPQLKGYIIVKVLYSNEMGEITEVKINELETKHLSRYYRN
jgi:hypothetical protein